MDALYQNALLYAIGWAILHSFWQMALAWMTFQLLFGFRKNGGPELRYIGAVALLATGGLLFLLTGLYEYQRAMAMGPMLRELTAAASNAADDTGWSSLGDRVSSAVERFMPYLSSAYLIVLFLLAARLWNAWLQTRDIRKNGLTPLTEPWTDEVREIAAALGLGRIGIYLSDRVQVPVTLGHLRPLILLPVAALNYLTVDQAKAVLLHEIAHIRRRDYLVNIGVSVLSTLLFFNPFVHALQGSLRRDREMCCDDFVLQCRQDAGDYARALMSLEQFRLGLSPAMAMAATGNKGQLLNRVKRILDINNGRAAYGQRLFAFLFLAVMLSTLAWIAPDALNGPGADNRSPKTPVAQNSAAPSLLLPVPGTLREARPITTTQSRKIEQILTLEDTRHRSADLEVLPSKEPLSGSLLMSPPSPVPPDMEDLQTTFPNFKGFPDGAIAFEPMRPNAPLMRFTPALPPGHGDFPDMIFIAPSEQDILEALTDETVKVQVNKQFKELKGVRITTKRVKELERSQIALAEMQQQLSAMRADKNSKRYQDWQKKFTELQALARVMRTVPNEAGVPFPAEDLTPDPEAPARNIIVNQDFQFSFSNGAPAEHPVKIKTGRTMNGIVHDRMGSRSITIGAQAPVLTEGVNLAPQSREKGVRIIVVEQEPRNIEIRVEQE